ncbi:MAG: lysine 5,6-aminomutase subunit alpha [Caldisericia bacterium]|nr:lysine 5,6-aminomutase subunit alpha [Caldisericia bacterium]
MEKGILNLNEERVLYAKEIAKKISEKVINEIKDYSTVSIERGILRLLGIKGVDSKGVPIVNLFVEKLKKENLLSKGVLFVISNGILNYNSLKPEDFVKGVLDGKISLNEIKILEKEKVEKLAKNLKKECLERINNRKKEREELFQKYTPFEKPYFYVIVATGNIYEDAKQASSAAYLGADYIAIIRSTAQSLLDYVPYGLTTEGYGGTYATQENFKYVREKLDDVTQNTKRYIKLVNYSSGLCMPEISIIAALERLDLMVNDALYGILFRNINPIRTMIDQKFSRFILSLADIPIVTGEDNLIKTVDSFEFYYTVIVSQLINEQLAKFSSMNENQIGLGHAYELDPNLENSFLYEVAQAQLVRELFPKSPIKYMPPTRYKTGNIFFSYAMDTLFNIVSILTDQEIVLLGMLTEALHTPFVQDRYLAIENAKYIRRALRNISKEFVIRNGGLIETRAKTIFEKAVQTLEEIESLGLFNALEKGYFSNVKRPKFEGRGYEGVFKKDKDYIEFEI